MQLQIETQQQDLTMTQKGPETRAKAKEKQIDYEKAFPVFHTREEILTKMYDLIDCPS